MDRLVAMRVFVRVAEMGSFTRAGESLGLAKASVSNSVQQLEGLMGTRLMHRTTRMVKLTHYGRAGYERCKDLLSGMVGLESLFQQSPARITGRLRVDMPTGVAKNMVIPKLPDFFADHPGIELELSSTDRRVDLIREGFDCVVRIGQLPDSGTMARHLGGFRVITCSSPGYIQRYGEPRDLDELHRHFLIQYVQNLGAKAEGWEYWDGNAYRQVEMKGRLIVNNSVAYTSACLAGLGMIQVPYVGIRQYLEAGDLVEVLPQYRAEPMPVSLIYPHRRNLSRRVQVFMDWLTEILKPHTE